MYLYTCGIWEKGEGEREGGERREREGGMEERGGERREREEKGGRGGREEGEGERKRGRVGGWVCVVQTVESAVRNLTWIVGYPGDQDIVLFTSLYYITLLHFLLSCTRTQLFL